jgi:hypothetical protein
VIRIENKFDVDCTTCVAGRLQERSVVTDPLIYISLIISTPVTTDAFWRHDEPVPQMETGRRATRRIGNE